MKKFYQHSAPDESLPNGVNLSLIFATFPSCRSLKHGEYKVAQKTQMFKSVQVQIAPAHVRLHMAHMFQIAQPLSIRMALLTLGVLSPL